MQASDQLNAHVEANFTIFLRDAFEGNWSTITAPDLAAYASFGMGISCSETSNLVALGSYREDMGTGSVYIYRLEDNGTKTFVSKIYAPDKASGDLFGIGLSISQIILLWVQCLLISIVFQMLEQSTFIK